MYCPKQNKVDLRRKFEARMWKKGETFREYVHHKIISNHISIDDNDTLDYLIDEISDIILCNQARIQCFATKEALIEAFDKITLREQSSTSSGQHEKKNSAPMRMSQNEKSADLKKSETNEEKRRANRKGCYNCGQFDHLSSSCLTKELGPKYFKCDKHGHIASKCPEKKDETTKEVRTVASTCCKKFLKTVNIMGKEYHDG